MSPQQFLMFLDALAAVLGIPRPIMTLAAVQATDLLIQFDAERTAAKAIAEVVQ